MNTHPKAFCFSKRARHDKSLKEEEEEGEVCVGGGEA